MNVPMIETCFVSRATGYRGENARIAGIAPTASMRELVRMVIPKKYTKQNLSRTQVNAKDCPAEDARELQGARTMKITTSVLQ